MAVTAAITVAIEVGVFTAVIDGGSSDGINRRSSKHSSDINGGSNRTSAI